MKKKVRQKTTFEGDMNIIHGKVDGSGRVGVGTKHKKKKVTVVIPDEEGEQ